MANHEIFKDLTADKTTPQGTQENAVLYGHDDRDVFVGSIMRWLVGVGVGAAVLIGILVVLFGVMKRRYEADDRIPSPLFASKQLPPKPRIEGFAIYDEYGRTTEPRDGTPEHMAVVREQEAADLKSFGLGETDPDNYSTKITPQMASKLSGKMSVAKAAPKSEDSAGLMSDASGGTLIDPQR